MPRTIIVDGNIVTVPDHVPRQGFQPFSGQGQRLGRAPGALGAPARSNLLDRVVAPRRARIASYPSLQCPAHPYQMSAERYQMLLTIREYMELSIMGDVLVFGASKEIEYPFLCTPCCRITMVSVDDNDVATVLARLDNCCTTRIQLLQRTNSRNGVMLRVRTGANPIPLTINLWKLTYGRFRTVAPSKRYDCLIDKASWLYTDPQGWADYLDKLKVGGYLITDIDYTWEGAAPWLTEVFGLRDVTDSVVGYFRRRHVGYGYDGDSARVYVKVKDVPTSLMHKALVGIAAMDPLLKLLRHPDMPQVGSYLEWHKFRNQAELLQGIAQHARELDRARYGSMAVRLGQVYQRFITWIDQKEREDRDAGEHYLDPL